MIHAVLLFESTLRRWFRWNCFLLSVVKDGKLWIDMDWDIYMYFFKLCYACKNDQKISMVCTLWWNLFDTFFISPQEHFFCVCKVLSNDLRTEWTLNSNILVAQPLKVKDSGWLILPLCYTQKWRDLTRSVVFSDGVIIFCLYSDVRYQGLPCLYQWKVH